MRTVPRGGPTSCPARQRSPCVCPRWHLAHGGLRLSPREDSACALRVPEAPGHPTAPPPPRTSVPSLSWGHCLGPRPHWVQVRAPRAPSSVVSGRRRLWSCEDLLVLHHSSGLSRQMSLLPEGREDTCQTAREGGGRTGPGRDAREKWEVRQTTRFRLVYSVSLLVYKAAGKGQRLSWRELAGRGRGREPQQWLRRSWSWPSGVSRTRRHSWGDDLCRAPETRRAEVRSPS